MSGPCTSQGGSSRALRSSPRTFAPARLCSRVPPDRAKISPLTYSCLMSDARSKARYSAGVIPSCRAASRTRRAYHEPGAGEARRRVAFELSAPCAFSRRACRTRDRLVGAVLTLDSSAFGGTRAAPSPCPAQRTPRSRRSRALFRGIWGIRSGTSSLRLRPTSSKTVRQAPKTVRQAPKTVRQAQKPSDKLQKPSDKLQKPSDKLFDDEPLPRPPPGLEARADPRHRRAPPGRDRGRDDHPLRQLRPRRLGGGPRDLYFSDYDLLHRRRRGVARR
jgi:hypothetical protein